ncbi:TonB-dependent receptor [Novosphingobium sp. ERN07]|uniref:TonB-dependent receptor n=1 Tax=Novosphingobium sp. ERN07 TaxID=2726187 RepID=UPI00145771FF|nr:TonB-dependent receptor [Novosphingobium sp. ERN07]NLR70406.1 TonB-dependent receptor [Novosphingobium sp. ERN07]
MKKTFLFGSALTTSLIFSANAFAQEAIPAAAEEQNVDTIVVTAQKFEQKLVDVPITISAVTGDRIRELGVSDLDELSAYVPGLNIQEQSANNPGVVIRGITSDSGSAQQGPRVTLYYNGVDISRSRGSYQAIYDLERVEVIKGPQATLFGTASAVGAISMVSKRPEPGVSAMVTGGIGNYNQTLLGGFLNSGDEKIAARIAFEWRTRDGYVENLAASQDEELYAQDQLGLRLSVRWKPSDRVTVDLIGTYDRQRNGGTPFVSGTYATANGPANPFGDANLGGSPLSATALGNSQLGLNRDVYDANLTITAELSDAITFTTVNGYRDFDSREVFDADGSAAWYLEFAENAKGWQASHEGRFSFQSSNIRASAGWNVFKEDSTQAVPFSSEEGIFLQCAANVIPGIGCINTAGIVTAAQATALATGGRFTQIPYSSEFINGGKNTAYSVFADATWMPSPALEVTAGARYVWEERTSTYFARVPRPVLNPTATSLVPGQVDTDGQTFRASGTSHAFLPRFNVLYRLSDRTNVFATISKGRRSPVVQLSAARVSGVPQPNRQDVPEETVWNYEVGLKGAAGPVSGSIGVYYQKYDGFQVSVQQSNGTTVTQSAGTASNLGVEAEVAIKAADWLQVFGNVGYIDGGIDKDNTFAPAFSGARFRLQPEWQAAGGFTINAPVTDGVRFFVTPSVTYRSKIFFELPNRDLLSQGPVTLVNVRGGVSFADGRYEISAFMRNATDKDYLLDAGNTGGAFGIPTFIPAEPRMFGAALTARF